MEAVTPRQGRKFEQVLDGARRVFIAQGYEHASVDDIARAAGVSKATLYSYFADKRQMFVEVYRAEIEHLAASTMQELCADIAPEQALGAAARRLVGYLISDFGRAMYRICVNESARFPEIGQAFYDNGPALGRARLGCYLRAAAAQGDLVIEDFDLAADQFFQLCQTTLCDRTMCNVQTQFSEAEIARVVDGAVAMFMARYAVMR
ncbi:MAG: TetR/AcrR family transcriptional regulator [Rhodobacteraceae bacterium]|nr:TetR/AcrR family transcriptional regulator [Paracoccaceae bacterium]